MFTRISHEFFCFMSVCFLQGETKKLPQGWAIFPQAFVARRSVFHYNETPYAWPAKNFAHEKFGLVAIAADSLTIGSGNPAVHRCPTPVMPRTYAKISMPG